LSLSTLTRAYYHSIAETNQSRTPPPRGARKRGAPRAAAPRRARAPWRNAKMARGGGTTTSPPATSTYSVIVPTYNERENIPILAELLAEALDGLPGVADWELVVVDDASPDGTASAVRALQRAFPPGRVVLAERPAKLGLGSAYAHGLRHARGELVALMDADLSHHPRDLARMIEVQRSRGADVVTGTRYRAGGGVSGWGLRRKLTSRGANVLASALLGTRRVGDLTGAYRLYRRPVLERLLREVRSAGYAFQMEAAARCEHWRGTSGGRGGRGSGGGKGGGGGGGKATNTLEIAEVPIVFVDRLYGQSKLGSAEVWLFLKGLLRLLVTL
jgi:dolichol-phosphate mannosyltransferase